MSQERADTRDQAVSRTGRDLSARRIVGFGCNQAFVFLLLYAGGDRALEISGFRLDRLDLLATLLFATVGFAVVRTLGSKGIGRAFSRPLLFVYAVVAAAGSLLGFAFPDGEPYWAIAQGALVGVPLAYLLTAWGRAFGREPTATSVPEVFIGSLVGALIALVFSFGTSSDLALLIARVLPLASVVNIEVPDQDEVLMPTAVDSASGRVRILSAKIFVGTVMYGFAAGLVEAYRAGEADMLIAQFQLSIVLLGAFLIGCLSLLMAARAHGGETVGGNAGEGSSGVEDALSKSYRLSVFLMLLGALLVLWGALVQPELPVAAFATAGHFGLVAVLVSLFIVMAKVSAIDCALSFSAGFSALLAGEFVGVLSASVVSGSALDGAVSHGAVVLAGAAVLVAYLFLFTDRDFVELSQIATASDTFEDVCDAMTGRFGLSKRESEILAFALRGRTSERIAQELVISKSTVDTHLRRIYAKCSVHSRQELLDLAETIAAA